MTDAPTVDDLRRLAGEMIEELRANGTAPGIEVGQAAPDFTLPNAVEGDVRLADRLADGPVVVVFYRGAWCPYCNTYLRQLKEALDDITERNASVIAISPQAPDESLSLSERLELGFEVLSDTDQSVSEAWRLRFAVPGPLREVYEGLGRPISESNADGSWNLPVPATFVLDGEGVVRARHVDPDYRERMELTSILGALDEIAAESG